MTIKGHVEYKSREFCKDVKCPVQLILNSQKQGSEEYERQEKFAELIVNTQPGNSTTG